MVRYQDHTFSFQQLSSSIRNWIALVGDVVRRLCLLNPHSLFPCQEGTGILLIDEIDHQLDQDMAAVILPRLHQAFPNLCDWKPAGIAGTSSGFSVSKTGK